MALRALTAALASAALLASLSCASAPAGAPAGDGDALGLVDRALAAQGGAPDVGALRAVTVKGTASVWEPEQSVKPGGEPRFAGDATFTATRDLAAGTARIEWVKKFAYPAPREYRFTEVVTPSAGAVLGVDTTARTKQSQDSNPPRHAMSGVRLAAAQRELLRTSPRLLADVRATPQQVKRAPDVAVDGARLPAVTWTSGDVTFTIAFDPATGLPARVRTLDADNVRGDSTYDLVLSDWRPVGGVKIAHAQRYELSGTEIVRTKLDEVTAAAPAPGTFDVPADLAATAPRPATGAVPYQWALRRQHIGVYLDSDAIHYDPQASTGLRLVDLAPGVQQVVGGTHNSLVVELPDGLAVVDSPIDERQSRWTLDALRTRHPGRAVRYLVLTHHHMDHVGGLRAYVADGATLVVGAGAAEHYRRHLAAPDRLSGGILASRPVTPRIEEVADRKVLGAGDRTLETYRIDNPHADSTLIAYVPHARLGFVTDIWSPGRDKLGETPTPGQAAVVAAVRKLGITPERFAGGHGSVAEYAALDAIAK